MCYCHGWHHREPEHFVSNKNKCNVIYLCPCVFFESFRRDLNEAKAVSCNVVNYLLSSVNISHLPLCNYDALITSQVSSNVLTIRLRARVFYEQIVNEAQPS